MLNEFPIVHLESLCDDIVDCPHSTPKWTEEGIVVIRNQNIRNGRLDISSPSFTNEENYAKRSRRITLSTGDLIITREAPMGEVCLIPNNLRCCLGQRMVALRVDITKVESRYLLYALQSRQVQYQIGFNEGTGSTVSNMRIPVLKSLEIPVATKEQQKAIAHILGTLDDKIELNHKMNQTLEEIAKAIFKSWFVDFDPVRAKAEGRPTGLPPEISDLFPDELVESEVGEIPMGWEVTVLGSQLSFVLGGDWGKAEFSDQTPNRCLCIRGADIANLQCYIASDMPIRYLKDSSFAKRALKPWDVVFEISGGSPTQSTGRSVLVTTEMLENYDSPLTTSNFCRLLRFNSQASSLFHYYSFRSAYDRDEYFQYETGTTGIKNFGFKYYSEEIKYVLPSESCLKAFSKIATPMIEKLGLTLQENEILSSLRDTLLPKLISGELRVPDAEKFLEEAGI